jgi:hypothetical protein
MTSMSPYGVQVDDLSLDLSKAVIAPSASEGLGGCVVIIVPDDYDPAKYNIGFRAKIIVLNEGLQTITDGIAAYEHIYIPHSVTKIDKYAFSHFCEIKRLLIPNSVVAIGERAFDTCKSEIRFEEGTKIETIGKEAFYESGIRALAIPDSVQEIGESAFANSGISKVGISPNSHLEKIGKDAFKNAGIETIYLPATIKEIASGAFNYISYFNSVTIAATVPPKVEKDTFGSWIKNIFVPAESLQAYKDAWLDYKFTFKDQLKAIQ